jgi:hypothetical protein
VGWPKVAWNQCILWPGPCHPRAVLSQALSFGWCRPKLTAAISMIHPSHRRWSGPRALGQWQSTVNSRANHLDRKATAPFTAVPAAASGTFNPLCKVLCILQSLYLCAIGLKPVFVLALDTPRTSNCSPKPLYSWMQAAAPRMTTTHSDVQDSILLLWTIPGRFLVQ